MKTIAQQLNIKEFPFIIKDKNGRTIYYENSEEWWYKWEYDSNGNYIYYENSDEYWVKREFDSNGKCIYDESSNGLFYDNRSKGCEGKVVEIDGKKYKLVSE